MVRLMVSRNGNVEKEIQEVLKQSGAEQRYTSDLDPWILASCLHHFHHLIETDDSRGRGHVHGVFLDCFDSCDVSIWPLLIRRLFSSCESGAPTIK